MKIKSKNIEDLFKKVKLLILDVDGVLTKGDIIYDDHGRELKVFNVKDGLGIYLLGRLGIKTILLTARNSPVLKRRVLDMRIEEVIGGVLPKENNLEGIKEKYQVKEEEICFVGDDLIDLEMIKIVGAGVAVADASAVVRKNADYVTKRNGGEGAAREVVDLIIKAKKWEKKLSHLIKNPAIFLLGMFFLGLAAFSYAQDTAAPVEMAKLDGSQEDLENKQSIKDFYLTNYKEDGSQDWEMNGDQAYIYGQYVDIDVLRAKYYTKEDTVAINSQTAKLDKENMNVYLRENVEIETDKGLRLETESLDWKRGENLIETEEYVKINNESMQIEAQGLTADTLLKTVDFEKKVEVVMKNKEGGVTTITCDGPLEIIHDEGRAIFNENVIVVNEDRTMFADQATAFFDTVKKELIKVVSEGNVKIVQGENITLAQTATYFGKGQRLVLEGHSRTVYIPEKGADLQLP